MMREKSELPRRTFAVEKEGLRIGLGSAFATQKMNEFVILEC